jgi:general secretion pathway protein H
MSRNNSAPMKRDAGFTLLEVVCVLAIVAMLAGLILPAIPHGTSHARLEAYAVEAAAILEADRNAAIRRQVRTSTWLDASAHTIRSGATTRALQLPSDVAFDALLARQCNGRAAGTTIDFFPAGTSCGGTIALARLGSGFQVRVNWLTGGIELVTLDQPLPAK